LNHIHIILLGFLMAFPALGAGNLENGQKLAETHCARCHVIGEYNKFGGIGSTPSFRSLRGTPNGIERFRTFFARRPHPAFVSVPNVPRWTNLLPYATPFEVSVEGIEDIIAFVQTLK
tara:strand:+ start:1493 stop:1846 length:354 start_codon:yes stop_codon:yes gene_type:complete